MFAQVHSLPTITPAQLDDYLERGWFRMRQTIFSTHFLCFNNEFYSAIWLRAELGGQLFDANYRELYKRNKNFTVRIQRANITQKHEDLYQLYKESITFQTSENLHQLLYGFDSNNRFDTYEINILDGTELIAAGYFDLGQNSAAGIVSFYHPQYKKYSLGKYIIYSKMEYCRQQQLQYFYPGYVAPGYPLFEYKLSIAKSSIQFYNIQTLSWQTYSNQSFTSTPLQVMYTHLNLLQEHLKTARIRSKIWFYRFFDAGLDTYFSGYPLFDFPVFLFYQNTKKTNAFKLIVYHVSQARYMVLECSSLSPMDMYVSHKNIFSDELLQVENILFSANTIEEVTAFIAD